MSLKSELICCICKLVLSRKPISLPCSHAVCSEHLRDGTAKDGSIRCLECQQEFNVPSNGFPANKIVSNVLTNDLHLSDEEKTIKTAIQVLIQQLEQLQFDLKQKQSDLEQISFDHFTEVRRQIDLQREELKSKIDQIALKMISHINEKEKVYKFKSTQSLLAAQPVDIEESRRILLNEFRNPNLVLEEVKRLQNKHEQNIGEIRAILNEFDSIGIKIKSMVFKPSQNVSFGILTTDKTNEFIACAAEKKIILLDFFNQHLNTLEGHTNDIKCLEAIAENRFASGSEDKTIRIWDTKNFVCLKTLSGHQNTIWSLKKLTLNRLSSGSYKVIKIWDIESGDCLQTINGHYGWINDFVYLPNGNLMSCTDDATIKVWDLAKGECIQTLTGRSSWINCLLLLKNGQLASGLSDNTITIWNMANGECIKTLKGHSDGVLQLQQLESGELVSCSSDNTIKIWNLTEDACIRTLNDHTDIVSSIRVDNHTLVSSSLNGTINTWDLNGLRQPDECISTIVSMNDAKICDLILI